MPSDLWDFAQRLYGRPGVENACLQLQEAGADVCLLLGGAWLQRHGVACTPARLAQLQAIAQPWQAEVISPLRQLRQSWRKAAQRQAPLAELRERLKGLELDAEQQLLLALHACAHDWPPGNECAVPTWLEALAGADADPDALQLLRDEAMQA
ncbi:MAG: TIGR02444 family protein [Pseudomonas sp.]|nr:TIGR02444 family protein [Pseudomonas sp.]